MFKLAHISDVHLSPLPVPAWRQLASKRVLGYINWKKNRRSQLTSNYLKDLLAYLPSLKPDHIIVSGDLINLGLPGEYENARTFLETLGDPKNVTAVCGNHDAYVSDGLANSINAWREYMSADATPIQSHEDFPILRIRGEIAIIGCNSAEATAPFMATGYFRQSQAEKLQALLAANRHLCRVICIHHPPFANATHWHKRLIGDELFREVIADQGTELVLHGHTHLATSNQIKGPDGNIPVICVPATGNSEGHRKPAGRINLFSIERQTTKFAIKHEAFGYSESDQSLVRMELQNY